MADESLPESASISLENWVVSIGTIISQSSQEDLYRASNLTLHDRTERWWTEDSTSDGVVAADFGTPKLPKFFGLGDSNLNAGETVKLTGSDNSLFNGTGNDLVWTFDTWEQSLIGRMLRWHMGDPDSGTAAARPFWELILPANGTSDANHKLGTWWLGEKEDFLIEPGARFRSIKPPRRPDGSRFFVHREIGVEVSSRIDWEEHHELREKLEIVASQTDRLVVFDMHGSAPTDALKAKSAHLGLLDDIDGAVNHAENSDLSFTFQEVHEEQLTGV